MSVKTKMRPCFARVLLQRERARKIGAIIVPKEAQQRHAVTRCSVVAMGPNCELKIEPGTEVLIGKFAGDWINESGHPTTEDEGDFFIVQEDDILAELVNE